MKIYSWKNRWLVFSGALYLWVLWITPILGAQEEGWYIGKPIREFVFTGLTSVSVDELRPIIRPYVGQKFSYDLFWEIQEKLYAVDYFESIEVNAKPGAEEDADEAEKKWESVVLEFVVVERPTISKIEIIGNRRIGQSEILDHALLKKGDMVSTIEVKSDEKAIEDLYLEKGFDGAQITGRIERDEKSNSAHIIFEIIEGKQTTIESILFSGNIFASDSTLQRIMQTKIQSFFSPGIFQENTLAEDLKSIQEYYGENGYLDVRVVKVDREIEKKEDVDRNFLILTLFIEEGDQYTYGGMQFVGNQVFSTEKLDTLVRQTPGRTLNTKKLTSDFQRIVDLYSENGYIFNQIDLGEQRDEENLNIVYTVKIVERDRAHIESIIFEGNEKTQNFVLERQLPFEVGDIFNRTKIIQGYQNLYNLQYFSTINLNFAQGSALGLMDVIISFEETNTADIRFGVMFSGDEFPVSGLINWSEKNFLGLGQTFGVSLEASPVKQTVSFNFLEPWILGIPWSGGISFSFDHSLVQNILQDILPPIFQDDSIGNAVPDPYDGHYVFSSETEFDNQTYSAGDAVPRIPKENEVTQYNLLTDYNFDRASGETIASQYMMRYDSYDISAGMNTGYRHQTFVGWFGIYSGFTSKFRFLNYDSTQYRPFEENIRDNQGKWSIINKLNFNVYWDNRDILLNPQNGFYLGQGIVFTGGILGGQRHYIRSDSKAEGFLRLFSIPLFDNWDLKLIFAAHSAISFILPQFGESAAVTDNTDLLYIDGMSVARGWNPINYGRVLWDNRSELRMPIAEQLLWWVLFFDGASLWTEISELGTMSIDEFFFSVGTGIRFTIPQFPIRLYISQGFQIKDGTLVLKQGDLPLGSLTLDFVISLGGDTF